MASGGDGVTAWCDGQRLLSREVPVVHDVVAYAERHGDSVVIEDDDCGRVVPIFVPVSVSAR